MSQNLFYDKYLKYKNKYLQLKSKYEQVGGAKPLVSILKGINLFTDPDMEQYLNPIYGVVMEESGFIKNNFYLHESGIINTPESQIISQVTREIPGSIQPTKYIMQKIKPETIGKYIGFLYIKKSDWLNNLSIKSNELIKKLTSQNISKEERKPMVIEFKAITDLTKELNKFNKENVFTIKPGTTEVTHFHILLYCLWWICTDKSSIAQYYNGINEVFELVNSYIPDSFIKIPIPENFITEEFTTNEINNNNIPEQSFELILAKLLKKSFTIFYQEYAKSFCDEKSTYADCGETTVRNFLNLISYNTTLNFYDVNILCQFGATEQLIEYYTVFNTPNIQASYKPKLIFGEEFNARDAWSKVILSHGTNISWASRCHSDNSKFELNSKMAADGSISNINQIIKNLLTGVSSIDKIKTEYIEEIKDETSNGVGVIKVQHKTIGQILINCDIGHYYMVLPYKPITIKNLELLTEKQIKIINLFQNWGINENNYLWYYISGDYLPALIDQNQNKNLKIKLLELSLTNLYNEDVRKRININVEASPDEIELLSKSKIANQYSYSANNFDFISPMNKFTQLNVKLLDVYLTSIDLTPLNSVEIIRNNFLSKFVNIKTIDLTPLANVKTIGHLFLSNCPKLITVNLEKLLNIEEIGENFLSYCPNLTTVSFSSFNKVKTLNFRFFANCIKIEHVDLTPMKELEDIGFEAFSNNISLKKVNLNGLNKLKKIDFGFLNNCYELEELNMQELNSLELIPVSFLSGCKKLKQIDLTQCPNLKEINSHFASGTSPNLKIICTEKQKELLIKTNPHLLNKIILM